MSYISFPMSALVSDADRVADQEHQIRRSCTNDSDLVVRADGR